MEINIYLSGEIHSDWREKIISGIKDKNLPVNIFTPVTDHLSSDDAGDILGNEESGFWKDHKSAKVNMLRIKTGIDRADIVIVKFGEKYRQWNAAFDAGYAIGKGKPIVVIHPEEHTHALKEIDANAMAVAQTEEQVIGILEYVCLQK